MITMPVETGVVETGETGEKSGSEAGRGKDGRPNARSFSASAVPNDYLTMVTGTGDRRTTYSAVLPRRMREIPSRP